jgi:hypothetical protein
VDLRHAEHRHHGVADELFDRAAVALDRHAHGVEVPLRDESKLLGIEDLAHRRRPREVAEDDRHRLPHLR